MSGPHAPENAAGGDPAERLWQLWRQGQRPDVDAFLAQAGPLSPDKVATVLRVDQRQRWQAGERVLAESYLQRYPPVRGDAEAAIDLVFNEFLVRDRLGERPDPTEYLRRFPEHADVLREQIDLYHAMQGGPSTGPGPTASSPGPTLTSVGERLPDPERRSPAALVLPVGPQSSGDVQTVLRKRLLFTAVFSCVAFGVNVVTLLDLFSDPITIALHAVVLPLFAALAWLLWSGRPLSLRQLRSIEVVLLGCLMLFFSWIECCFFFLRHRLAIIGLDWADMIVLARSMSFSWAVVLIAYGLLIPNTWRRALVIVGGMALWPILLHAVLAFSYFPLGEAWTYLREFGFDVGTGAALALYGANRIEVLRQKALESGKVGPYRLKQRLGSGGMGEVYLAEHGLLRRPCAVKLIRPERAGDPHFLRRFEREVQAMATLTHPNTVEVYDYGHAADGTFYYAMEYLPGLDLEQLVIRHGPLPPGRAVHLLRQVCGALAEAHAIGLIHRDIKPSNVMVCERGGRHDVAKLLDFGLVRAPTLAQGEGSTLTQVGTLAGTPAYMAPEQAAGKADLDGRSDLYSLGAVAYFLLTGQPPFVRQTAVQTLNAHLTEAVVPPGQLRPELPADLEQVVLRCLEKEPARRFPDADALEQALTPCACAGDWSATAAAAWRRQCPAPATPT
jgi:serine/threonine-protein kinase